jgi:hypothetical protein
MPLAIGFSFDFVRFGLAGTNAFASTLMGSVAIAIVSAPGYYRAWEKRERLAVLSRGLCFWIASSLIGAIAASAAGVVLGRLAIVPSVLCTITNVGAVMLLLQSLGRGQTRPAHGL